MKIANGLEMLEINGNMMGHVDIFNATLIWDDFEVVLIDTGLPGQSHVLKQAVENAGVSFDRISKIIFTHHDGDHVGDVGKIVNEVSPSVKVLSHEGEKPYIQGELMPIKMTPERKSEMNKMLSQMPEDQRIAIKADFENTKAHVDQILEDNEELSYCGGIQVIHTPGHSPGHICLYLKKYKVLVTGDAMNVIEGQLMGPNPVHTFNMKEAVQSLKKLTQLDIESVICYHGGVYSKNVNERIGQIITDATQVV